MSSWNREVVNTLKKCFTGGGVTKLACGKQGCVYKHDDRIVKIFNGPDMAEMRQEFDLMNSLKDISGIPHVYALKCGNLNGFEQDLLNAVNLSEYIRKNRVIGPKLQQTIIKLVENIHSRNIVHLDLHDQNVMISKDGKQAFVIDFGLGKRRTDLGDDQNDSRVWQAMQALDWCTLALTARGFEACKFNRFSSSSNLVVHARKSLAGLSVNELHAALVNHDGPSMIRILIDKRQLHDEKPDVLFPRTISDAKQMWDEMTL